MTLEKLEERASNLRLKKIPLYCSDAHTALWAGRGANNMAYLGKDAKFAARAVHEPADLTEWLATRGLQTGEIPADGLCQYRAFSRALFGDEKHHKELQYLAVTFLRLHKARYLQSVTVTELVERKAALQELVSKGAIVAVNYDGWCEALEYGLEWGQDYTLEAMCLLMLTEARLVKNLPREYPKQGPRVMTVDINPTEKAAPPIATIYLYLCQLHYSTLEEKPAPAPAGPPALERSSQLSYDAGSLHTAADDRVRLLEQGEADEDGLPVAGIEYSIAELKMGVNDGEGNRLVMEYDAPAAQYVIWREHRGAVGGSGYHREVARTIPKKLAQGPAKPRPSKAPALEIIEDDVNVWLTKLNERRFMATKEMAQAMYDAVSAYIDRLELTRSDTSSTLHHDQLGNKMHEILETLKLIQLKLETEAYSEDVAHNKIAVIGIEGAGKSTTINALLRAAAKPDAELAAANEKLITRQVFHKLYAYEPPVDEAKIHAADEQLQAEIYDPKKNRALKKMKPRTGDILPTGRGGSMTALVTTIRLDPTVTAATLSLTYRTREVVDKVLAHATTLRDTLRKVQKDVADGVDGADEAVIDLEDSDPFFGDPKVVAYMVCDMVGGHDELLTAKGSAEELLRDYEGEFSLLPHEYELLGRRRELTVAAPSHEAMAKQVLTWLTMHTVGKFSHWPLIEKVELVLPSTIALRVCDVPGFGAESQDPFRQGLVKKSLDGIECSSMLFCLPKGGAGRVKINGGSATYLEESGALEEIFGDHLKRRVGHLLTTAALDWALEKDIADDDLLEDDVEHEADSIVGETSTWLNNAVKHAAKSKGVGTSRIDAALKRYTRSFAVDVTGKVEEVTGCDAYRLESTLLKALIANAKDSLERRQRVLFERLVRECLQPFYSELSKMGALRKIGGLGLKVPKLSVMLLKMKEAGNTALINGKVDDDADDDGLRRSGRQRGGFTIFGLDRQPSAGQMASVRTAHAANTRYANVMYKQRMEPLCDKSTPAAVQERYLNDEEFEDYSRKGSRTLGQHLKNYHPKLMDFVIPAVSKDMVLPVQDFLRDIEEDAFLTPLKMMSDQVKLQFALAIKDNRKRMKDSEEEQKVKEWLDKLDALETLIEATLLNSCNEQQHIFRDEFKTLLQALPQQLKRILAEQGSKNLQPAASARGNPQRMVACAKKAPTLAESVSKDLKDHVLNSVLDVLHTRFHDLQERVCKEVHRYFVAVAENLESRDFERLEAFAVSQRHARFCAGLIAAIHLSPLRTVDDASLVADFEGFRDILKLSEQPPGLITHGEGLEALRTTSELVLATGAEADSVETDADAAEWHCPSCNVSLRNTNPNAIGVYGLSRPTCGVKPGSCWCEKADPHAKYCKLCVNFFRKHHQPRSEATERRRMSSVMKRKSSSDGLPSPTQHSAKKSKETALVPLAPAADAATNAAARVMEMD